MKPLHINTSDIQGGAARAAYRLHRGLQQIEIPSKMLVQKKSSANPPVMGTKINIKGQKSLMLRVIHRAINKLKSTHK